ncbi:MAG: 50S ribosomal protein L9 [Rikenellaceae bacterium]|nr:50S ribosomal protein L9 [Rikenellaceae bacterium]
MQIILIKDVQNVGYANDIVDVKPGYANNFLIPQGYAKLATESAKKVLAENLRQRAHKDAKILADAQALAEKIANLPLSFTVKTTAEGKIFGSVTSTDVAEALAAKDVVVDKKDITLDTIKEVGTYEASIRLHREVKAIVSIAVNAEGATEEVAE